MAKIDFVPDDYIRQRESNRTNFLYLILFGVLMSAVGVTFSIIKVRQRAVKSELNAVVARMSQAQDKIARLEELKLKSTRMMKTMLMTAELLEPVPRSVILASLTNSLPAGASLLEIKLTEQETKAPATPARTQYQAASEKAAQAAETPASPSMETTIEITGIAPSDIEVANYISTLSESIMLRNVSLVESKEHKIDKTRFREFKLKTMLKKNLVLTKDDIKRIKEKNEGIL